MKAHEVDPDGTGSDPAADAAREIAEQFGKGEFPTSIEFEEAPQAPDNDHAQ
jgi:hypothetical protein